MKKGTRIIKVFIVALLLQLVVFGQRDLCADEKPKEVSLSYSMNANGSNFANISMDRRLISYDGKPALEESASTSMSIMVTNNNFSVSTSLEKTISRDGKILSWTGVFEEDKSKTELRAGVQDGWLVIEGREGSADFEIWSSVDEDDYDLSVAHLPFDKLELSEEEPQIKKILDLYSVEIKDNKMQLHGKEMLTVDEKVFECDIVTFAYGDIEGKMWIAKDELGYILVKEDAVHKENGPFQMVLDTYTIKSDEEKDTEFGF